MCGIVEGEDGVAEGGGEVGTAFAAFDDDFGDVGEGLDHVFRLFHVDKTDGGGDDAGGVGFASADEVAEFHEGGGGIAEGEEGIGVVFDGQTDGGLGAGEVVGGGELCHAGIVEVAFGFDAETGEGTFADAALHHGHIGDDGGEGAVLHFLVETFHGFGVGVEDGFHVEVGGGVDGVEEGPEVAEGVVWVFQFGGDGAEGLEHDGLAGGGGSDGVAA